VELVLARSELRAELDIVAGLRSLGVLIRWLFLEEIYVRSLDSRALRIYRELSYVDLVRMIV